MVFVVFIILLIVLAMCSGANSGGELQYEDARRNIDRWISKVTNESLEAELLFAINDNIQEYIDELEPIYQEIEAIYVEAIKPVYKKYVANAALRGEDTRQRWADDMLIDSSSPLFNARLRTTRNKHRILMAKRGYLCEKDASDATRFELGYMNPVEGIVLKWCADTLTSQGLVGQFQRKDDFIGSGYGKGYKPPPIMPFTLSFAWPYNGWDFWGRRR